MSQIPQILSDSVELVQVDRVRLHPRNPRRGNVDKIADSIRVNGFAGALLVQRSTGFVIAGNHRLKAAISLGMAEVPVMYLDVDDDRALRILLADNKSSDDATNDQTAVAVLLQELAATDAELAGTCFFSDELAAMLIAPCPDAPPESFEEYSDDIETEHECPKCHYRWSGKTN